MKQNCHLTVVSRGPLIVTPQRRSLHLHRAVMLCRACLLLLAASAASATSLLNTTAGTPLPSLSAHGVALLASTSTALRDLSPASSPKIFRISLRRSLSFISSLNVEATVVRGLTVARNGVWKHSSTARDAEIASAWIKAYCATSGARCGRAALAHLKEVQRESLTNVLRGRRRLLAALDAASAALAEFSAISLPDRAARVVVGVALRAVSKSVTAHAQNRGKGEDGLHALRIATKKLRFTVEPLVATALLTSRERSAAASIVDGATRLQDVLGELHDAVLLATVIESLPGADKKMTEFSALMASQAAGAVKTTQIAEDALALVRRSERLVDALLLGDRLEEAERRWLLRESPTLLDMGDRAKECYITQGFVAAPIYERLRESRCCPPIRAEACETARTRTFKAGDAWAHFEYEESVSDALWNALWPLTEGRRIEKQRFTVPSDDAIGEWEVDVFAGEREGLVIVEYEFAHSNATLPGMPVWLRNKVVREITGDSLFSNYNMATQRVHSAY